ncbi:MAG: polyprenol monophosphomannose synthase [Ilumatobacteraceae bacterium]
MRAVAIVPTYNEADNIEKLCRAIRTNTPDVGILVVDDNSPDGTAEIVELLVDELGDIAVLHRPGKSGLGAAYRAGIRRAIDDGAEICIQIDADFSHDPVMIPALVSAVEHGADLALGSRYVPGGITENWPRKRRALSRWANRYAAGVLGLAVNDATAGYRAYSSAALVDKMQFETVRANGYGFQVEMTHRLVRAGGRIVEIPIVFRDRTEGVSKMSQGIIQEGFVMVIRLWAQDHRGRRERRRSGG